MPLTTVAEAPAGSNCVIHSESQLLVIKNPTFDQVMRNRAILIHVTGNTSLYRWVAGAAFVDLYSGVVAKLGAANVTLAALVDALYNWTGFVTNITYDWSPTTIAAFTAATKPGLDVYTFKHGFASGVGATCPATADSNPNSDPATNSPSVGFPPMAAITNYAPAYPIKHSNYAYIGVPMDVSSIELGRRFVQTMNWKPDARPYVTNALRSFMLASGFRDDARHIEMLMFTWGQTGSVQYQPPSMLLPWGATSGGTAVQRATMRTNPFGGRIRHTDGSFVHLPALVQSAAYGSYSNKAVNYYGQHTNDTDGCAVRFRYATDDYVQKSLNNVGRFLGIDAYVQSQDVSLAKILGGQPYGLFYSENRLTAVGAFGTDVSSQLQCASRWGFTSDVDTTQTESQIFTELGGNSTTGVDITSTAVSTKISGFDNTERPTNYDSIWFTARKLRRIVTEAVKCSSSEVYFDQNDATRIMNGQL